MPSKAVEPGKKERYPQQHVRPGRGVPGYKGEVEVYSTPVPKSFESDGGIKAMQSVSDKAKQSASDKGYDDQNTDSLRAELQKRGLETDGKKAELVARLEEDDS